jgi:adenylate cyclase
VNCALSVLRSAAAPDGARQPAIRLRIGINLGDGLIEGDDIYGDGVNIAARLEPFAESGLRTLSWIVRRSFRCSQAILVFVVVGVFLDLLLLFHAR